MGKLASSSRLKLVPLEMKASLFSGLHLQSSAVCRGDQLLVAVGYLELFKPVIREVIAKYDPKAVVLQVARAWYCDSGTSPLFGLCSVARTR